MTPKEGLELIGGLSDPSKMPWYGYSIPAKDCVTGSKLRLVKGSTCSKCYAMKGFYRMPNVERALEKRLQAIKHPDFVKAFVLVLTSKFKGTENRFRWHDSGDLQDVEHLTKINEIALQTPFLRHYLPTRETGIVNQFVRDGGTLADNLFLKISNPMVGQTFKNRPSGMDFSTVGVDGVPDLFTCPALKQGNKCLSCDACWRKGNVNYPLH